MPSESLAARLRSVQESLDTTFDAARARTTDSEAARAAPPPDAPAKASPPLPPAPVTVLSVLSAARRDKGEWQCPECSDWNDEDNLVCEMCFAWKCPRCKQLNKRRCNMCKKCRSWRLPIDARTDKIWHPPWRAGGGGTEDTRYAASPRISTPRRATTTGNKPTSSAGAVCGSASPSTSAAAPWLSPGPQAWTGSTHRLVLRY